MTIFELIRLLEAAKIHFTLASYREGDLAITATCTVPGERWEIEVFEGGHVEFEVFHAAEEIEGGEEALARIARFSD